MESVCRGAAVGDECPGGWQGHVQTSNIVPDKNKLTSPATFCALEGIPYTSLQRENKETGFSSIRTSSLLGFVVVVCFSLAKKLLRSALDLKYRSKP